MVETLAEHGVREQLAPLQVPVMQATKAIHKFTFIGGIWRIQDDKYTDSVAYIRLQ